MGTGRVTLYIRQSRMLARRYWPRVGPAEDPSLPARHRWAWHGVLPCAGLNRLKSTVQGTG
jgi:hypothetical protein